MTVRRVVVIGLWVLLALTAVAQQLAVSSVGPIGMTVSDVDRSIEFYARVLQFTKIGDEEFAGEELEHAKNVFGSRARVVKMKLGEEEIELTQFLAPEGSPFPLGTRGNDRWFQHVAIIVRDMDEAYAWLRKNNIHYASTGPQTLPLWNKDAGGIKAFYFRDPDGHFLELLEFPPSKGNEKWRHPSDRLFLGIDHTAITVGETSTSLRFYQDVLGMKVAGTSENYGMEQEHLNNVKGAHLRITALRGASGPGIELLEYVKPQDGRPYPSDSRANDLLHWETKLFVPNVVSAYNSARASHLAVSSEALSSYDSRHLEFQLKDPDGHVMVIYGDASHSGTAGARFKKLENMQ